MIIPNEACVYVDLDDTVLKTGRLHDSVYDYSVRSFFGFGRKQGDSLEDSRGKTVRWNAFRDDLVKGGFFRIHQVSEQHGCRAFRYHDLVYVTKVRPTAFEFLKILKNEVKVAFLTSGDPHFQAEVVSVLEFDPSIPVLSTHTVDERAKFFVLVDDLPLETNGVMSKMETLRALSPNDRLVKDAETLLRLKIHFFQVDPWNPDKPDEASDLVGHIGAIRGKLVRQIRGFNFEEGDWNELGRS